jgi:hypothetical protein
MSVLKEPYATPGRIRGVYRYVLHTPGRKVKREQLKNVMSPQALAKDDKEMIRKVVNETVKMGLFNEVDGILHFPENAPSYAINVKNGDDLLPLWIADLFFSQENETNHDMLRLIAWYLSQNIYSAPEDKEQVDQALAAQIGESKLGCTSDVRYGQFEYWSCFLGFAWKYNIGGKKKIISDPTAFIRKIISDLFADVSTLRMADFAQRLGKRCPVLEGGSIRETLNKTYQLERRPEQYFSSSTSHALLRLQEEGVITLNRKSDADIFIITEGNREHRISEISWTQKEV